MSSILVEHFKNHDFTKGQNRIAQYMIEHEISLSRMSLMELSKAIGVSDASVLRFVRYVGFDSYNDFKERLYQELTRQAELAAGNGKPRLRDRMSGDALALQLAAEEIAQSAEVSVTQNPPETYEAVAEAIRRARTVYVCGARGTLTAAEHFARILRFPVGSVTYLADGHDIHAALCGAGKTDLLIFFCTSRFYESDVHICQAARASDTPICLVTNSIPSPLTPYAAHVLLSKAAEKSFFNSMVGMTALSEYLVMLLSQRQGKTLQNRLDSFDHFTREERCQ